MPEDEKWVRLPVGFPPELHEWLRETAHHRRTKMSELVRQAVREYRERQESQLSLGADGEDG
jgi:predicted transcriptional regulator